MIDRKSGRNKHINRSKNESPDVDVGVLWKMWWEKHELFHQLN